MDAVGYMAYRNLALRPAREKHLKNLAADLTMQLADAIDGAASARRQVRHIERLGAIFGIPPAERLQIVKRYAEKFFRVPFEVLLDQLRSKPIETGFHRSVGGEQIARARHGERDFEWLAGI